MMRARVREVPRPDGIGLRAGRPCELSWMRSVTEVAPPGRHSDRQ
jgi:hypothetical protein